MTNVPHLKVILVQPSYSLIISEARFALLGENIWLLSTLKTIFYSVHYHRKELTNIKCILITKRFANITYSSSISFEKSLYG